MAIPATPPSPRPLTAHLLARLRSISLSLRFVAPLAVVLGLIAYALVPLVENLTTRWMTRDLEIRAQLVANTMQEPLVELITQDAGTRITQLFARALQDERMYAIAFCNTAGTILYSTPAYESALRCDLPGVTRGEQSYVTRLARGLVHISAHDLTVDEQLLGRLMIVHDMSFVERRSAETRRYLIFSFIGLGIAISLVTVLIAHLSWRGWVAGVRAMLRGEGILQPFSPHTPGDLQPLLSDLRALLRDSDLAGRPRDREQGWTPDMLRKVLEEQFPGDEILLLSNREPYIHVRDHAGNIVVQRPASGLVTAMEPIMRACFGTWIAHGSGNADRDVVDRHDHLRVPPEHPSYTLRRVWLTKEEELGYYYGFANEGLWPLCHFAHVRPVFRSSDWEQYRRANQRFADAVCEEARTEDPIVLIQDYHFALAPRLIANRLPRATIITFWHIPWPNSESFGICPWRDELLRGLLGSTILGFHTRFHRQNFVETVDRYLETRIERESATISYRGKLTRVEHYPISIQWPPEWLDTQRTVEQCRAHVLELERLPEDALLGIGVDRMDYTKGILERFAAIERLFELHPEFIGRFVFVQIAAPSRSSLEEYRAFEARVHAEAARINERFGRPDYEPVRLKAKHHPPELINEYYRASSVCVVTSLHDGMNLVAKEYVGARDDELGVLVLSQFTGAARELTDALVVNPYHAEQCAHALHRALTMPPEEQRVRMHSMRRQVREFNIFWWAGAMLEDAARLRQRQRVLESIDEHRREAGLAS